MPTELLEASVSQELSPKAISRKIRDFLPDRVADEFRNSEADVLKPLPIVIESRPDLAEEFNQQLERDFAYYSRTHDLEINTERTKMIQGVADRLTEGSGIQTRVVIMRKSRELQAFVVPDGTIFISQSLINRLDSMDEIAGVLAHEVGHLINKTSVISADATKGKFGVGWAHETACDLAAPQLLEKAGFRSWAFATAIEKISGMERGAIHQSGLARASESVGSHLAIDRETSSQEELPIPENLKGNFVKTNLEIAMEEVTRRMGSRYWSIYDISNEIVDRLEKTSREAVNPLRTLLEKLHPRDFEKVYRFLLDERERPLAQADKKVCDQIIISRFKSAGYSDPQIKLFLISALNLTSRPVTNYALQIEDADMFATAQDTVAVVDGLEVFEKDQTFQAMSKLIFSRSLTAGYGLPTTETLLTLMERLLYDINFENQKYGVPVTEEILLDSLEKISAKSAPEYGSSFSIENLLVRVLGEYILKTYLSLITEAGAELDRDQIREFFQDVKTRGIKFSPYSFIENLKKGEYWTRDGKEISAEDKEQVIDVFRQVYEIESFGALTFEKIDKFFADYTKTELTTIDRKLILEGFLRNTQDYFIAGNIPDEKRLGFARYLSQKIDGASFSKERFDSIDQDTIIKFNLQTIVALAFFSKDSEHFYSLMEENMQKLNPYLNNLSRVQLINICQGLFALDRGGNSLHWLGGNNRDRFVNGFKVVVVENYEKFFALPAMKRIMSLEENLNFQNIQELNSHVEEWVKMLAFDFRYGKNFTLYGDDLLSLIAGRPARKTFAKLLENGISEEDYDGVYAFISNFYPAGPQKDTFLREINKLYLRSPNVALEQKIEYMLRFYNQVGPEAMLIVADQIEDIDTFRYFRNKLGTKLDEYLEGKQLVAVNEIAAADLLGSQFVRQFEKLLMTAQDSEAAKTTMSSDLADRWFELVLSKSSRSSEHIVYDTSLKKFVLDGEGRTLFKTVSDAFAIFKGMSDLQKFVMIHKSLTDTNGALTSTVNRRKLADLLLKSLGIEKGFMASVLSAACTQADAKLVGIPISSMLTPVLFRALDIDAVDIDKIGKRTVYSAEDDAYRDLSTVLSREDIVNILRSDSRSISVFGARYQNQPLSQVAGLAHESDQQFLSITNRLNVLFNTSVERAQEVPNIAEIDPAIEAVIKGVETSGALGIRALQLATQFHSFPPPIERRLSDTFDANPGLEKLRFWENLYKLAEGNEEIRQYLQRITLGNYLGGGSLQTTYAAILDAGTPNERQVIVKMKNPNVDTFIKESYISAHKTLGVVSRQRGAPGQHAKTGMVLMDLAQNWCLDDLNDKTFLYDDEQFRHVIGQFNAKEGAEVFYAPVKLFTASKMKSETLAPGKTANQFLNDQSVSFQQKQEVVRILSRFFIHQLKGEPVVDAGGNKYHLVHSDPHVGNYMVDVSGATPRIGVIDRSMYLKLQEADIKVLEKLAVSGNDNEFVYGFVDRVLDINKIRGIQRTITRGRVFVGVGAEYAKQKARGKIDRFSLMRVMLSTLADAKVDVPLELRLMIRNIGAFQELGRRYGVDFEALYKEAA